MSSTRLVTRVVGFVSFVQMFHNRTRIDSSHCFSLVMMSIDIVVGRSGVFVVYSPNVVVVLSYLRSVIVIVVFFDYQFCSYPIIQ